MTIYHLGHEAESIDTPAASGAGSRRAYSRSTTNGLLARTGLLGSVSPGLADFWAGWVQQNGTTIGATNATVATFYNNAAVACLRLINTAQNSAKIQVWNGAAWVDAGIAGINGPWSTPAVYILHVNCLTGFIEMWTDGVKNGEVTLGALWFNNLAIVSLPVPQGSFNTSEVVLADESLLGFEVWTMPPSGNGTDVDGVYVGAGTVADVNETAFSAATYLEFSNAGDKRSFVKAATTMNKYVKAVLAACHAMRVDGTGPQQIRPYILIAGVRYYGTTFALTTTMANYKYAWNLNPATGAVWTTAAANAANLEIGWEAVA